MRKLRRYQGLLAVAVPVLAGVPVADIAGEPCHHNAVPVPPGELTIRGS